jgi:hypothetical protein
MQQALERARRAGDWPAGFYFEVLASVIRSVRSSSNRSGMKPTRRLEIFAGRIDNEHRRSRGYGQPPCNGIFEVAEILSALLF